MTIYVVDSENVAQLIENIFTFVLENHWPFCARSLSKLPLPEMNLNLLFRYGNSPYTFIW